MEIAGIVVWCPLIWRYGVTVFFHWVITLPFCFTLGVAAAAVEVAAEVEAGVAARRGGEEEGRVDSSQLECVVWSDLSS